MTTTRRLVAGMIVGLLLAVPACGDDDEAVDDPTPTSVDEPTTTAGPAATPTEPSATATPEPEPSATVPAPTPTEEATATPSPPPEQVVNVYWGWTIDSIVAGTPERIAAGGRVVATRTPATAAMEALLAGPNGLEQEIGMTTLIPEGTRLLGVTITDGVATVDLSSEFEQGSGTLAEFMRVGQVVFTLTQFDTVDTVTFEIDGEPREALASHGIDVSSPVDRDDFEGVRALIMVERPYPGEAFASGDRIIGESNTFEANVVYTVTDPEGLIIAEGFTTATAGNGVWGRFDVPVVLDTEVAGRGAVIVFEISARDGSQVNVVEYPVELTGA